MLKKAALCSTAIVGLVMPQQAGANNYAGYIAAHPHPAYVNIQPHMQARPVLLRGPSAPRGYAQRIAAPQLRRAPAQALPVLPANSHPRYPHTHAQPAPQNYAAPGPMTQPRAAVHRHIQAPQLRRAPLAVPLAAPGPINTHGVDTQRVKPNQETDILRARPSPSAFKISVDGQTVAGQGFDYEADQRATDKALEATDIQVKFDGLDVEPMLNVGLKNDAVSVALGEPVEFFAYSNYQAFISQAEIRVFSSLDSRDDVPMAILPVNKHGYAKLHAHPEMPEELFYQLRVYDPQGRFDETHPRSVKITDKYHSDPAVPGGQDATFASYGVDRTLRRNINIKGGAVTVYGRNVPAQHRPFVFGRAVPLDPDGNFVAQEILPFGDQAVTVAVVNGAHQGVNFKRNIHIKDTEFFYVAIGDITLGQRAAVGPANLSATTDEDFDDVVVNGRGAFYLKGKVKGEYLITAAMDTGEDRINRIFKNLDEKDPRQLLRRLDADRYYPVYGDDSYTEEGAPTQGKFYVRVDKDDNHIMWGNFATQITGTEYAQLDRGLYGAVADYNSDATTRFGERKTEATVFAADPGTIPGRDIFRGTGGSVYFLKRQDISIGSERVRIEIRDKVSGRVLQTQNLKPQEDYDIDYIQGRILLSDPLQSTVSDGQLVRDGGLSGHETYLVTRYEYTPGVTDIGGYTLGGRATQWVGNHLRVGVTAQNETTDTADQELYGVDALLRRSDNTYIKGEYAQSEGPGFGQTSSTDGGFIFDEVAAPGAAGAIAKAYRLEAAVDLKDLGAMFEDINARINAALEHKDEGFSGVGNIGAGELDRLSLGFEASVSPRTDISVQVDDVKSSRRGDTFAAYADIDHDFNAKWSAGVGVRYDERDDSQVAAGTLSPNRRDVNGSRTDASAEIRYDSGRDWTAKAFAQGTVQKDGARQGNSRAGIGADVQLNSRMSLAGEVSSGEGGLGANAQLSYQRSENSEFYLGYALSTGRSDTGYATERESLGNRGTLTAGSRTRFNDALSVYGEEQFSHGGRSRELTHTYGVDYAPNEKWTLGATIENGTIEDEIDGDFERTAFSVSASRASSGLRVASNLEGRFEEGFALGQSRDRTTWLMRNTVAFDAGRNWEMLGRVNFALSESDQTSFLNSDYVEGVVAAAYRPIHNDRINGLFKYTYFEDLSPAQQVNARGRNNLARQRSQILSADMAVDVSRKLTLGGKVGYRKGEVALDRAADNFIDSDAVLGVLRADYHVVSKWDLLLEGRVLSSELAEETKFGALAGAYRHVGDNLKVGGGYSFSKFSDDMTDFSNTSNGFFVNMIGKF